MNGTWLRNRPRHLLAILTVSAALGCVDLGSGELPDQVPIVTDSVETASQFNANQLLITNNLGFNARDAAATAFFNYASIKLEFYNTNSSLPDPMGSPGAPDWPDPFQDPGFYQTYANNHHAYGTVRRPVSS